MDETDHQPDAEHLEREGEAASRQTSVGSTPGSPTWPIPGDEAGAMPPPVGLNWRTVAGRLRMDLRLLEHEGLIVLAGEYFPAAGVFIDPETFAVQHVDVGGMALRHGYFIGNMTAREFSQRYPPNLPESRAGMPVVRTEHGPIIGLFASEHQAKRARAALLQGALGSGLQSESGPLGIELRVERPERPGMVASLIAGHGGAVISVAGRAIAGVRETGSLSTAPAITAEEADTFRQGTGATSDSEAPARETGGSEEFTSL